MQDDFPPRGAGKPGRLETAPNAQWGHAVNLGPDWDWTPGKVLLGKIGKRELGLDDDRHVMTLAGTGGGKTSRVLKENVARWLGSMVILDPKGELTKATIAKRRKAGHRCYVLDPFGITGEQSASYNPFGELGFGRESNIPPDAALAAEATIIASHDPHWSDSGRNFCRGVTLLHHDRGGMTIRKLRKLVNGTPAQLNRLFEDMVESDAFDGIVSNCGTAFLGKQEDSPRELAGILSTVQEQTAPLDDVTHVSDTSDFSMADLAKGNTTIYLVLPGMRMLTHFRWLRLILQAALAALERHPVPFGGTPVLFVLEEFAALGPMRSLESAAGLMRGYGVKLWTVLQDLTQLQAHYPKSWETFLGNAGVIQGFANADVTTTEHLSKMLGMTLVLEQQTMRVSSHGMSQGDTGTRENLRAVRLLEATELTRYFARQTNRQLVLVPGLQPLAIERMPHYVDEQV